MRCVRTYTPLCVHLCVLHVMYVPCVQHRYCAPTRVTLTLTQQAIFYFCDDTRMIFPSFAEASPSPSLSPFRFFWISYPLFFLLSLHRSPFEYDCYFDSFPFVVVQPRPLVVPLLRRQHPKFLSLFLWSFPLPFLWSFLSFPCFFQF